ncbi:DUF5808 domain-containing protein, partial [Ornithobacterium rhinotracheale]
ILLFVTTGYFPKISSILQAWVHLSICNSFISIEGGDQIASNLSLLLIPICLLDKRKNQWQNSNYSNNDSYKLTNIFTNIYFFLISLQVSVIYLHAAVGKIYTDGWKNGTCLYYWFTHNVYGAPLPLQKIYSLFTLSSFAPIYTWSVIIFELGLFACILATNKFIKYSFLFLGIIFHLSIAITHGLITFFFSMCGALILYLDSNNYIYKFFNNMKNKNSSPWVLGFLYYNKDDKRIFPPKRTKLGWTINFANPLSIIFSLLLLLVIFLIGFFILN